MICVQTAGPPPPPPQTPHPCPNTQHCSYSRAPLLCTSLRRTKALSLSSLSSSSVSLAFSCSSSFISFSASCKMKQTGYRPLLQPACIAKCSCEESHLCTACRQGNTQRNGSLSSVEMTLKYEHMAELQIVFRYHGPNDPWRCKIMGQFSKGWVNDNLKCTHLQY